MLMKQKFIVAVLLVTLLLTGCATSEKEPTQGVGTMRISAILPHNDYGYWTIVADGMREADKQLPVDVKIHLPDLNYNIAQMTELIEREIAAQVDALVVQGIEDPEYIAALEKAKAQGICVVLVDTDLTSFQADLYVGTDNYAAGLEMGNRLVEVTEGESNVVILSGSEGYPNLEERLQGIRDVVAAYPKIQIMRVEYDQYDAMTVMEKYYLVLRENPEIDTLVAIEGTGGQTLGQMASTAFDHVLVFDDTEESIKGLKNGVFDGIVGQQNYEMGKICVEELYRWFTGDSFDEEKIYTSVNWVTLESVEVANEG